MKVTPLNQQIAYKVELKDFNNNVSSIILETNKPLDITSTSEIKEALLDYIADVRWNRDSNFDASKLSFLNEYGEEGEFYLYIDNVIDEPLCKVIDSLIRLKEIEAKYISRRELFEILLTLCFKNFK